MSLVEIIANKVVEVASSAPSRIAVCAAYGVSCEGWLKVELFRGLVHALGSSDDTEILPEAQKIDLTVGTASEQVLLELKTFRSIPRSARFGERIPYASQDALFLSVVVSQPY